MESVKQFDITVLFLYSCRKIKLMQKIFSLFIVMLSLNINAQSDSLWSRCYGGSADEPAGFGSGYPGAPQVSGIADSEGNLYVVTYTNSDDSFVTQNFGLDDVWVIKIGTNGDTLWTSVIGGSNSDRAYRIVFDTDKNLLIAGKTLSGNNGIPANKGDFDGLVIKVNAETGATIWIRTYGGSLADGFYGILPTSDGGYLLYGETGSIDGDINQTSHAGSMQAWVVKTNVAGAIQWQHLTNGIVQSNDWIQTFFSAVELPNNGGFWLSGVTGNFMDFSTDDILFCKYNFSGTQLVRKVTGSPAQDAPGGLAIYGDKIFVSARVGSSGLDVTEYNGGAADCWIGAFDFDGLAIWNNSYGGTDIEYPYDINVDPQGNLWVSAVTRSTNGFASSASFGNFDAWYIKINPSNGDTLKTIRKGGSEADFGHATAFTPNGAYAFTVGRTRSIDGYAYTNNGAEGTVDVIVTKWEYEDITSVLNDLVLKNNILIYPNPVKDLLTIQNKDNELIKHINITDISGKTHLFIDQINDPQYQADLSHLSSGIYFIRVAMQEELFVLKFMKQ
jgi:hypothetical protein